MNDPWFTYWVGPTQRKLVPRTGKGWASLILFILVIVVLGSTVLPWLLRHNEWLMVPYFAMIGLMLWGYLAWAISKSERVDRS